MIEPTQRRNFQHDRGPRMWEGDYHALPYAGPWRGGEVRPLYHCSYWDGPYNGLCLYQGQRCWFDIVDELSYEEWWEAEDDCPAGWEPRMGRRYVILEMSPEDLAEEDLRHGMFQEHVGTHTDYDENGKRAGGVRPQMEWNKFYDWSKTRPARKYSGRALAWFGSAPYEGENHASA